MLKIRLQRTGRKHEPTFRVVLTDSKNSTKSGRFLEILGSFDPREKNETKLKGDRIQYWIGQGAKPTDTLHNLLITKGIIKGEKINVLPKKTVPAKEETAEVAEAPKEEVKEESVVEVPVEEAPAEVAVEETPAPVVEETPVAEVVEEVKTEEAPVEEVKE